MVNDEVESENSNVKRDKCEQCGVGVVGLSTFTCRRCGKIVCLRCKLPELHDCLAVTWEFGNGWAKHSLNNYQMPKTK